MMQTEHDPEFEVSSLAPGGLSARRFLRIFLPITLISALFAGGWYWLHTKSSPPPSVPRSLVFSTSTPLPTLDPPGQPDCRPSSPHDVIGAGVEVQGTASQAQLWALFLSGNDWPIHEGSTFKLVIRMTGQDTLRLTAISPQHQALAIPMDEHGGSSWDRPGDEWGYPWTFTQPGCWRLHATRGNVAGDIWLPIAP